MSRIGKQEISIPAGVKVTQSGGRITVVGPKGTISKKTVPKTLRIGKVLSEKRNAWDGALFVSQLNTESWLTETDSIHPVWKNNLAKHEIEQEVTSPSQDFAENHQHISQYGRLETLLQWKFLSMPAISYFLEEFLWRQ